MKADSTRCALLFPLSTRFLYQRLSTSLTIKLENNNATRIAQIY